jgi:hypothetical protein
MEQIPKLVKKKVKLKRDGDHIYIGNYIVFRKYCLQCLPCLHSCRNEYTKCNIKIDSAEYYSLLYHYFGLEVLKDKTYWLACDESDYSSKVFPIYKNQLITDINKIHQNLNK